MSDAVTADMRGQLLAEHYQKTYELTHDLWRQRNSTLVVLLVVVGLATLLVFRLVGLDKLLALLLTGLHLLESKDAPLVSAFPFAVVQGVLLFAVFYLMSLLYRLAQSVQSNYQYLGELEKELRAALGLGTDQVAFTREGSYYWNTRPGILGLTKYVYSLLLGLLLAAFFGGTLRGDVAAGNWALVAADALGAAATTLYFAAYARCSVALDRATSRAGKARG